MTDRNAYIAYLLVKVREEDWHAVSDAANDLRVLDERPESSFHWVPRSWYESMLKNFSTMTYEQIQLFLISKSRE